MICRKALGTVFLFVSISVLPTSGLAATVEVAYSGGILTITYPDNYASCSPADMLTVSGITDGHPITIYFQYLDNTTGWILTLGSVTTGADGSWSFPYPVVGGEMFFLITILDDSSSRPKVAGFKWSITCEPDGGEGCTPGYWRNHLEDWPPTGYGPSDIFDTVFGTSYFSPTYTLNDAVWQGGGGVNRLARIGAAALLNAAHPDVDYPYTVAQVIAWVQAGVVDPLAVANELACLIPY